MRKQLEYYGDDLWKKDNAIFNYGGDWGGLISTDAQFGRYITFDEDYKDYGDKIVEKIPKKVQKSVFLFDILL